MKNFFTSFFGAIIGVIIAGIVSAIIFGSIVIGGIKQVFNSEKDETFKVKPKSVLMIDFKMPVTDRTIDNPFASFNISNFGEEVLGLSDIVKTLAKAKSDTSIKGIYLNLTDVNAGMATTEEIRNALLDFKTSGKFIYAYSEVYSQRSYYLASVANKVIVNPQGGMEFKGLSSQLMFFKNALEKLSVEIQVFRHGKFKSAIEPFLLDKMSEANRLQTETFLGSIWNNMLLGISKQRGLSVQELNEIADNIRIQNPTDAKRLKLVDELMYEDEVMSLLKKQLGLNEKDKITFVKLANYKKIPERNKEKKEGKPGKIAIIYAIGQIESGEGDDQTIGSDRIAKAIREARLDSTIKAIVLRVNSPGGSALASDVMWRESVLAKKSKPFIVSMGDVAASGGYYISCAADRIFAQPNTITGSIGVFGIIPNAQKMLSEKLGITLDTVNTNKHSDVMTIFRPVAEDEKAFIQKGVEDVYDVFTKRVAEGRGMKQSDVDSIGQGRVWSGVDALKIKLVDELGGLNEAVAYAAKKANVTNYKTLEFPKVTNPLDRFMKKQEADAEARVMQKNLGEHYVYLKHISTLLNMKGIQARMPFDYIIN